MLSIPLAFIQGYGFLKILETSGALGQLSWFTLGVNILVITAGSMLLVWIGELISEFGIGNGVSLIIFAGIVASLPRTLGQLLFSFTTADLPLYIVLFVVALVVVFGVQRY